MLNQTKFMGYKSKVLKSSLLQGIRPLLLSLVSFTMIGCSIQDDFGRTYRPHTFERGGDIVGSIQEHTGILSRTAAFHIPLTQDEHTLRQTLSHFRKPFLHTPTLRKPTKTQTIARHKSVDGFKAYFSHQIRADRLWLRRYSHALKRVMHHDIQRYEVIAGSHEITENDGRFIKVRIRENRSITMRIMKLMDKRLSDYDKALDYSRLNYPESELTPLLATMDKMRSEVGLFKAKYESYTFERSSKLDAVHYD